MQRKSFGASAAEVIRSSDLVLEILDARFAKETRNLNAEKGVLERGKKLLLVLNKSDLVSLNFAEKTKAELLKEAPCVFISAKDKKGKYVLRKVILREIGGKGIVGIIGYPNTGKSSIINALAGRKAAKTSSSAGFTKGKQRVRLKEGVYLIDSPGVLPFRERDEEKLLILNAKSPEQVEECTGAAEKILGIIARENPKALEERYGMKVEREAETKKLLEAIALKRGRLSKGGKPDSEGMAKQIVLDWQRGKISLKVKG
ncbi:MAG: GTPase [archaeon]